ncbi:hypothetical protein ACFPPD_01650 [Cohnella suwonensis]|uniref:DUF4129 domain-containing protein n=1 Tax=Cohnella suwonensis TaxID=696072 RepID=A0ABW0LNT2_9BACL
MSPTTKSMAQRESLPIGKGILRVLTEGLLWLPVWLMVGSAADSGPTRIGLLGLALTLFSAGLLFHATLPTAWRRVIMLAVFVLLIALGLGAYPDNIVLLVWGGVALWRGRYAAFGYMQCALGFGIAASALSLVAVNDDWSGYKLVFILLSFGWMIAWFVALNRHLMEEASLLQGIATGAVKRANRTYVYAFLAASVSVVALTAEFGSRLLTPKNPIKPNERRIDPEKFIQPPSDSGAANMIQQLGGAGGTWKGWDVIGWGVLAGVVIVAVWFVRLWWRDRKRTWQSWWQAVLDMLRRERRAEDVLPYVEERRSLAKKRAQSPRIPTRTAKADWERLGDADKVRRLYEEAVLAGIGDGFEFRASDTPSETLERIERHRLAFPVSGKGRAATYWAWFAEAKPRLLRLYEKAKYSAHAIGADEVGRLRERKPK